MTGEAGLVSVVIPSYNYGHFVVEAVQSALAQSYTKIEVLVIDDGSTDDTAERLKPFMDRIRYVRQDNRGLSAARNTGIREARGEWVALLDADDVWHAQKLEVQTRGIEAHFDAGLVGSPSAATLPAELESNPRVRVLSTRDFVLTSRFGPSGALMRKAELDAVGGFDETLRSTEDRDMWLRLSTRCKCVLVESGCWWYRLHPSQMNRNAQRMFSNHTKVLNKFFAAHPEMKHLRRLAMGYTYYDAAWSSFAEGSRLVALWRLLQSAWYRPLGLGDEYRTTRLVRTKTAVRARSSGRCRQRE